MRFARSDQQRLADTLYLMRLVNTAALGQCVILEPVPKWVRKPSRRAATAGDRRCRRLGPKVAVEPRRVGLTPPASPPCAGRRHKWLRTERGSLAPSALGAPATELGSNNGRRNSARGLQSVRQRRVLSRR